MCENRQYVLYFLLKQLRNIQEVVDWVGEEINGIKGWGKQNLRAKSKEKSVWIYMCQLKRLCEY